MLYVLQCRCVLYVLQCRCVCCTFHSVGVYVVRFKVCTLYISPCRCVCCTIYSVGVCCTFYMYSIGVCCSGGTFYSVHVCYQRASEASELSYVGVQSRFPIYVYIYHPGA